MKIFELSKELGAENKEVIEFLNKNGVEVKSHMNSIEDKEIEMVKKHFGKSSAASENKGETAKKTENADKSVKTAEKQAKPVAKTDMRNRN